jgi:hypothetical protein
MREGISYDTGIEYTEVGVENKGVSLIKLLISNELSETKLAR